MISRKYSIIKVEGVSKCYVIESSIKYSPNGDKQISHKVVFPFSNLETLRRSLHNQSEYIGKRTIPVYDACNRPYPVNVVTDLFDSYEEAKIDAEEKNEEYKHEFAKNPDWKEQFKEFEQSLELCYLFEKLVLEATEDMNITNEMNEIKKLQLLK